MLDSPANSTTTEATRAGCANASRGATRPATNAPSSVLLVAISMNRSSIAKGHSWHLSERDIRAGEGGSQRDREQQARPAVARQPAKQSTAAARAARRSRSPPGLSRPPTTRRRSAGRAAAIVSDTRLRCRASSTPRRRLQRVAAKGGRDRERLARAPRPVGLLRRLASDGGRACCSRSR